MANILVVDDEEHLRELLVDHLIDEGHHVAEASNGKVALEQYEWFKPNLVISDINMPVMDGYEFLKTLQKTHPDIGDIPFFFLSALSSSDDQLKGLDFGIDEYLCKPVDFNVLTARINLALRRQEKVREKIQEVLDKPKEAPEGAASTETKNAQPEASEPDSQARRGISGLTSLLTGHRPTLSDKERDKLLAVVQANPVHGAQLINKIGRRVNISRFSFKKDLYSGIFAAMTSYKFDSKFFYRIHMEFLNNLFEILEELEDFEDKAIIIPTFFRYICDENIRDHYLKIINGIEKKFSIMTISEITHIPSSFSTYGHLLAPLAERKTVQMIEIKKPQQIKDIDIKKLNIGALSMDYASAVDLNESERKALKEILKNSGVSFYIKDITEGNLSTAQALDPDILSVSV